MNIKKTMLISALTAAIISPLCAISVKAYTVVVTTGPHYATANLTTYGVKCITANANHYAEPHTTSIAASTNDYLGVYKDVYYKLYGEQATGIFYLIDDEYNQGTTSSVTSDAMTITYEAARRTQRSRLYYTSSPTSSVKESFTAVITKP